MIARMHTCKYKQFISYFTTQQKKLPSTRLIPSTMSTRITRTAADSGFHWSLNSPLMRKLSTFNPHRNAHATQMYNSISLISLILVTLQKYSHQYEETHKRGYI